MTKRILWAGLLGGLALFMWGAVSHMLLGLGEAGVRYLPQQPMVMQELKASVPQSGIYVFPQLDASGKLPADAVGGAHGILIYHPAGANGNMGRQMLNEFLLNVGLALLAALLLSFAPGLTAYGSRVGFVVLLGLLAGAMTHVQYWNWYGFPTLYTVASIFDNVIGFFLVGLVVAAFFKPAVARVVTMPRAA